MSKPFANPFFEADFSKFTSEFKSPFNMEPLLAAQRRNIEAMTAVSQAAFESMQALARRQAELFRQGMDEAAATMNAVMTSPSPEEKVLRQAEASKSAMEKYIANARDIADTWSKCNNQAMEMVTNRLSESVEELRGMMKPKHRDAA